MKFYFTYGSDPEMPYQDGWTEVEATDEGAARAIFNTVHEPRGDGFINCAMIYDEARFSKTRMSEKDNFGKRCHERIIVSVERSPT